MFLFFARINLGLAGIPHRAVPQRMVVLARPPVPAYHTGSFVKLCKKGRSETGVAAGSLHQYLNR